MVDHSNLTALFRIILLGKASKSITMRYFFTIMLFFAIMAITAFALYPGGLDISREYISGMGDPACNPKACYFFVIGAGITGLGLIPIFSYFYTQFTPTTQILTRIFRISGIIGSIGFSIVGFFPRNTIVDLIHDIGSQMAFFGLGFAAFCSMIILIRKMIEKAEWPKLYQFILLYGIVLGIGALIPFQENYHFTQWTGALIIFTWIIGLFLVIPEKAKSTYEQAPN